MNSPIPARHPDVPGPVPVAIRLFAGLLGIAKPSPQRWDDIRAGLNVGDEPMRRLVDAMSASGTQQTRPIFDRILARGLAAVPDAPEPLREFFGASALRRR